MKDAQFYVGQTKLKDNTNDVVGSYVDLEGESFYKIENYDSMRPFFMTLVSSSDHWLFIASNGGLSAGRRNSDSVLFPYYTDDKIIDSAEITGSKSIFRIVLGKKIFIWEPFSDRNAGAYTINRNIYKNRPGNKIKFEEINEDLKVCFSYVWTFSDELGFVKKCELKNLSEARFSVELLDGIQNILPYGINEELQNVKSTLVDAYKKSELDLNSGLGIYSLSAMIVDKAEPSEALMASIAWSIGISADSYLLSSQQLDQFRLGHEIHNESDIRAERGAYFINSNIELGEKESTKWYILADVNQSTAKISKVLNQLQNSTSTISFIEEQVERNTTNLIKKVALADGLQLSNDNLTTGRHLSNVLFNIMRGGNFEGQYLVDKDDLRDYISIHNPLVNQRSEDLINTLNDEISYSELFDRALSQSDLDLARILNEYLPLSFSRRHGDPSRPWNKFTIDTQDEVGRATKYYEGNWRDIFQNWEALASSFPKFVEGMIAKFVNASTIDGYNPYRITRKGIDWEVIEPDDPWSYIGYWGDHQIIYLLKLLEISEKHNPKQLNKLLGIPLNVYANVPYRIKGYKEILTDPSDTIEYDERTESEVKSREDSLGADAQLVYIKDNELVRANLTEKILVTVLTKLYNFVPDAGIWLNTQRPEWNDANNALVGNGASMVTLFYLRRFLEFGIHKFSALDLEEVEVNQPVAELLDAELSIFKNYRQYLESSITDETRKSMMDAMGLAGESYRSESYRGFSGDKVLINTKSILELFSEAIEFINQTIEKNKREDGLFHSYNLIAIQDTKVSVKRLYEMLEGQVAALSSGYLSGSEALTLLDNLKSSKMFKEDQYSYMLYPDRNLATFMKRNTLSKSFVERSKLADLLFESGSNAIFEKDIDGDYHFNANFHNASDLHNMIEEIGESETYREFVAKEHDSYLAAFEETFDHESFTGRSGTFYGYEGLGSIYWHMVSKLLLATQECIYKAKNAKESEAIIGRLIEHYYEIRAGIGTNKSPDVYGAFPTDAYSHTPGNTGVQQPGMTGQVKEDIINRWAELGVIVEGGQISFNPFILREEEFLNKESNFDYFDVNELKKSIVLTVGSLAFTYCQVPIIYSLADKDKLEVFMSDGSTIDIRDSTISSDISQKIFSRTGEVVLIKYFMSN